MSLTRADGENKAILSGGREAMIDSAAHFIHAAAARHQGACPDWSRTKSYEETTTVTGGRSEADGVLRCAVGRFRCPHN